MEYTPHSFTPQTSVGSSFPRGTNENTSHPNHTSFTTVVLRLSLSLRYMSPTSSRCTLSFLPLYRSVVCLETTHRVTLLTDSGTCVMVTGGPFFFFFRYSYFLHPSSFFSNFMTVIDS